ncbi:MAG: hypothetical protein QW083_02975 [Methanomassiliicoccales archaeon]
MDPLLLSPREFEWVIVALLLVFGIALAFAGHRIYESILAIVGAFLGFTLGYTIGMTFSGVVAAYILGAIAGVILAIFFYYIVATAMALVLSAAAFLLSYSLWSIPVVSIIIAVAAFVIIFLIYDRLVMLFTAIVGGAMVAWALDILGMGWYVCVPAFIIVAAFGSAVQLIDISSKKPKPVVSNPPPTKLEVVKRCPYCGQVLTYLPEYDAWFCYSCGKYS